MNNPLFKLVRLWVPVVIWCAVIFTLSHIPNLNSGLGIWDYVLRKLAHMTEYAVLVALFIRALNGTKPGLPKPSLIISALGFGVAYAVSDEFHQTFVQGREGSLKDIMVDVCGMAIFLLVYSRTCSKGRNENCH